MGVVAIGMVVAIRVDVNEMVAIVGVVVIGVVVVVVVVVVVI